MKSFIQTSVHRTLLGLGFLAAALVGRAAEATDVGPISTTVLLLAPIDATSDAATRIEDRLRIARTTQQREFIARHFRVLGEAAVSSVPKIQTAKNRSADVLDALAAKAGTDWVVSITLQDIGEDELNQPDEPHFVHCTVMLQVRDTRRKVWLANRPYTGRLFFFGPLSDIFHELIGTTTEEALATVLWPYPVVVPVAKSDLITDYTRGATEPIVGHPGRIFPEWRPQIKTTP